VTTAPASELDSAMLTDIEALVRKFIDFHESYGADNAEGVIAGLINLCAQLEGKGETVQ